MEAIYCDMHLPYRKEQANWPYTDFHTSTLLSCNTATSKGCDHTVHYTVFINSLMAKWDKQHFLSFWVNLASFWLIIIPRHTWLSITKIFLLKIIIYSFCRSLLVGFVCRRQGTYSIVRKKVLHLEQEMLTPAMSSSLTWISKLLYLYVTAVLYAYLYYNNVLSSKTKIKLKLQK